jgi:integrase
VDAAGTQFDFPTNEANLTFQSLRRSFATLMQGKGTPKDAQTQLRHKDILMF